MTLAAILEIIQGVLKFPAEVLSLIRILRDTPEESREKIMIAMQKESDQLDKTGRPTWDT
jgi:hypothetical protein